MGYTLREDGTAKRNVRKKKGFRTKKEAMLFLPQLRSQPQREKPTTFSQLYTTWEPTHRAGKSTMDCYKAAYKHFSPVWNQPFREIDIDDLQACVDDCTKGKRTKENMKALCGLLYKYAIPRHLATMNLGQYLIVSGEASEGRSAIPLDALQKLETAIGTVPYADYVVAQCYLGFRPSEFLELDIPSYDPKNRTFTGGAKTEAGKNRVVPVSPKIQWIVDRLTQNRIAGNVFCSSRGTKLSIREYRDLFYKVLDMAGIDNPVEKERHRYTPHSCRHTFATMLKNVTGSDKDKLSLIGHTSTEMLRYYQDTDIESLRRIVSSF